MLLLSVLVIVALQPRSMLEAGSGSGTYRFPLSNGQGNQGGTPTSGTSGPSPNPVTPSGGGTATLLPTGVDFIVPANDTAGDSF